MADAFVAEIRIFGFNFAPRGWALCNGQLLAISQNTALFSLCGTTYGGDGRSTFALPNLQGNAALGFGGGPGLSLYDLGETGGSSSVTLLQSEIPAHTHTGMKANARAAISNNPGGAAPALTTGTFTYDSTAPTTALSASSLQTVGNSLPHNNYMPSLVLNFCIATQGVFPPRS
jgi:microcystin-dependent protein